MKIGGQKPKKRRFPFAEFQRLPKVGQKFEEKHLTELSKKMYTRLSELTGIPVKRLLPWRGEPSMTGEYSRPTHAVSTQSKLRFLTVMPLADLIVFLAEGPKTNTTQHEHIHSIINLFDQSELLRGQIMRKDEYYAKAGAYRASAGTGFRFQHRVNEFYRKFGVDGLLALYSNARKMEKWQDLDKFEHDLRRENILTSEGFTPKGIEWFKSRVPAHDIEERLKKIHEERKRHGLSAE